MMAAGTFRGMLANDPREFQNISAARALYIYTRFSVLDLVLFKMKEISDLRFDPQKSVILRLPFLSVF